MKTNLQELRAYFINTFTDKMFNGDEFKDLSYQVDLNEKKSEIGLGSLAFKFTKGENEKNLNCVMYLIESDRSNNTTVVFVNEYSHYIIFNNYGPTSVEKSKSYIEHYIERCIGHIYGKKTEYIPKKKFDKKPQSK